MAIGIILLLPALFFTRICRVKNGLAFMVLFLGWFGRALRGDIGCAVVIWGDKTHVLLIDLFCKAICNSNCTIPGTRINIVITPGSGTIGAMGSGIWARGGA